MLLQVLSLLLLWFGLAVIVAAAAAKSLAQDKDQEILCSMGLSEMTS
jgi:hypothetical protein